MKPAPPDSPWDTPGLHRTLGLGEVTAGGVGIIIGAGIYVLIGAATAHAGEMVWLAFVLAAVLSALTGLSYAELASMYPSAAAEYEYTRQALPEWIAFVVGWVMVAGLVVAAATVSLGFARYAGYFFDIGIRPAALALLAGLAVLATIGIKQSARVTVVLSAVQVGGLVFFAFIGFDEVITLAEETHDPTRTVPRALLLALGISTVLYIAVAVAAVSVLGAGALGASHRPLTDVMAHALGSRSAALVAAIAMISTTNTTLLALTAASRLLYGMAAGRALPGWIGAVHPTRRTPIRAIAVAGVAAGMFALIGELTLTAAVTDFAVYVVFLAVNATVILLRWTKPDLPRPFAVPWSVRGTPVLLALGLASVLVMLIQLEARAVWMSLAVCAAGVIAAFVLRPGNRSAAV
ncbi:MAG: APC family permease [Candidatus Rokubacteria bacterium]|nr:APC family permease [Candidatus Rokubacteria bacterium]